MKKRQVLKFLPRLKELRSSARVKMSRGLKMYQDGCREDDMVDRLTGLTLHNNFPLRITEPISGEFEVSSGCDEVSRWAYASLTPATKNRFIVTAYKPGETERRIPHSVIKKHALEIAKDWVATGKLNDKHV